MTDGVFNTTPPAATPVDQLEMANKRLADKDAYIAQLEREAAEKLAAIEAKETELAAARLIAEARQAATPPPSREATPAAQEPAKSLNEDELVERVLKAQEQRTASATAAANVQTVATHMVELYGSEDAANKIVADRAAELGLSVSHLLETAKISPKAFYDIMQLKTAPTQEAAPRGDVNTAALKTHAPGVKEGTHAFYEQLRKERGDAYFYTPKIQQQRMKDAIRLGDAFYT